MPHARGRPRGCRRTRSARLWPWPASSRPAPTDRSASGVPANWRMKPCGGGSRHNSRHGMPGGYSKEADLKPHQCRYWLTPAGDAAEREERIADVCKVYQLAVERAAQGERTVSTDELTGVQALERAAPRLPMRPGKVERREFEYVRHGTLSFMINFDVVSGQVVAPSCGPTRTE